MRAISTLLDSELQQAMATTAGTAVGAPLFGLFAMQVGVLGDHWGFERVGRSQVGQGVAGRGMGGWGDGGIGRWLQLRAKRFWC